MAKLLKLHAADNWQASATVVNRLGQLGLLDRVSTDGSWWIHHARIEQSPSFRMVCSRACG